MPLYSKVCLSLSSDFLPLADAVVLTITFLEFCLGVNKFIEWGARLVRVHLVMSLNLVVSTLFISCIFQLVEVLLDYRCGWIIIVLESNVGRE